MSFLLIAACGDDPDSGDGAEGSGGSETAPGNGSGGSTAAAGNDGSGARAGAPDSNRLGSELSAAEVEQLCRVLDESEGLVGNLERSCTVEAYLLTYSAESCTAIVDECTTNGATVLELESPSPCASEADELPVCSVSVGDMIACIETLGAFWEARTCTEASLAEVPPDCLDQVVGGCPSLFGGGDSAEPGAPPGGSGGSGRCQGIAASCFSQFSSFTCQGVDGCFWSSTTDSCSGVSRSCSLYSSSFSCSGQRGCYWVN